MSIHDAQPTGWCRDCKHFYVHEKNEDELEYQCHLELPPFIWPRYTPGTVEPTDTCTFYEDKKR